jgi:hypothetical protein
LLNIDLGTVVIEIFLIAFFLWIVIGAIVDWQKSKADEQYYQLDRAERNKRIQELIDKL